MNVPADPFLKPADLVAALRHRVLYQDAVIERVVPALHRLQNQLGIPGRPCGTFLFLGPAGVGKTELARAMANEIFGAEVARKALIRIDCGRLAESRDIVPLIGAKKGRVDYGEGLLSNALRDRDFDKSIFLFDEPEKAHPSIWRSLRSLFNEGILQDGAGTKRDAKRCLLIGTSRCGYHEVLEHLNPFAASDDGERQAIWEQVEQEVAGFLTAYSSPELLGCFGPENIVFFRHFTKPAYADLVRLQTAQLLREMQMLGIDVKLDVAVIELLANQAYERSEEGARPVKRFVTQLRDQIVSARSRDPHRVRFRFSASSTDKRVILEAE